MIMAAKMTKRLEKYLVLADEILTRLEKGKYDKADIRKKQIALSKLWGELSGNEHKEVKKFVAERLASPDNLQEKKGMKHLIECNCILPQYKNRSKPVFHKFIVFSVVESNGFVVPKYAQCNNCAQIHKVVEVGKSEFTGKDESHTLMTVEDIKYSIPESVREILDDYKLDIPYWEEAAFLVENGRWGSHIIIASEETDGEVVNKLLRFIGPGMIKIETVADQTTIS